MSLIDTIIQREGGYVDNPADRGGPTNMGITLATYSHWLGRQATAPELKGLPYVTAVAIYEEQYLKGPGIDKIADETLRAVVLDAAVNHGPVPAIKMLQRAVGATVDGILGVDTLRKAAGQGKLLVFRFLRRRIEFYTSLVQKDYSQAVFLAGWLNRALDQIEHLL